MYARIDMRRKRLKLTTIRIVVLDETVLPRKSAIANPAIKLVINLKGASMNLGKLASHCRLRALPTFLYKIFMRYIPCL